MSLSFEDYQKFTATTAMYPGAGTGNYEAMTYVSLKGGGETGEWLEKLGKAMRGGGSIDAISRKNMPQDLRTGLAKELGDRLWYIAQSASELGYTLEEIARMNMDKLSSRKARGVIHGDGDDR